MEFWIKAAQLILSLSILIVLHELGHFLPARWFNTRVEKFYLFFNAGFSLFKFKKGDTEYGIGWIPLGGYVKIAGMIDESMDKEQMNKPAEPWEFRSKPAWQRLIIMIGGVVVNLIVGALIYMMVLFVWGRNYDTISDNPNGFIVADMLKNYGFEDGDVVLRVDGAELDDMGAKNLSLQLLFRGARNYEVKHKDGSTELIVLPEDIDYQLFADEQAGGIGFYPYVEPVIKAVLDGMPAQKAGIAVGDRLEKINGKEIKSWLDISINVADTGWNEVTYLRNGERLSTNVFTTDGKLGIDRGPLLGHHRDYNLGESVVSGFAYGYSTLRDYVSQLKFLFTSKGASSLGGFGSIGGMFPAQWDWERFWLNTAFLSIILAFMNILPIPALDGGHVLFLIYEMVAGKAPTESFLTKAQVVGMVFLLSLLVYANGMDVVRWFS